MLQFHDEVYFGRHSQPFEVQQAITTLTINGSTVQKGFLYLLVIDPTEALRANILLEKPIKQLQLSATEASVGAIAGALPMGTWRLEFIHLVGEFRTPRAMQYAVDIIFDEPIDAAFVGRTALDSDQRLHFDMQHQLSKQSRWYRGDLHAHTNLSDGQNNLADVLAIAKAQHLDYLFLTEHNICHSQLPDDLDCLILPGIEVTTDRGHCNVHGPVQTLDLLTSAFSSDALLEQTVLFASEKSNLSINHPMMKPWHWWYQQMPLQAVNSLEVCCDPTWPSSPQASEDALAVLTKLWNGGRRIVAVGGSDSHLTLDQRNPQANEPSVYGDPATYVWASSLSGTAIIDALRAGRVYFERRCQLQLLINEGRTFPGDNVGDKQVIWQLAVHDRQYNYIAQWIGDGDMIEERPLNEQLCHVELDMATYSWVRVDIRRTDGQLEGVVNAVYNAQQPIFQNPSLHYWSDLNLTNADHNTL
ncbi:CehA/McbA family metallohydrolase [Celerinatantimonas yamalensis]|uniref:CehA/McbA family metallohydrolase n=1 Tax=Celerinatantimonas yamalensis TaxID=559956 RepID=A0ABW9G3M0_9GAMM